MQLSSSHPKQEICATFDRGRFLLKHIPSTFISDLGLISQSCDLRSYVAGCNNPTCPCKNFEDYESIEMTSGKLSPAPVSTSCRGSMSVQSDKTSITTPFTTPRDTEILSIKQQQQQQDDNINNNNNNNSNNPTLRDNQNINDEILKCYVNVFTRAITIALYISHQPISNIPVYVKNEYIQTNVQLPIIYSGKFDWENKLLISGSINGSTGVFARLVLAMKSAKEEIKILMEIKNILNTPHTVRVTPLSLRNSSYRSQNNISNNSNTNRTNYHSNSNSSNSTHSTRHIQLAVNDDNKRIFNVTIRAHFKIIKSLLFHEDFKKLNKLITEYISNIKSSSPSFSLSSFFWPTRNEYKFLSNPKLSGFIRDIEQFNLSMNKHFVNGGMTYRLLPPTYSEGLCLEVIMPSLDVVTNRIIELTYFYKSTLIKG
jgi:hypothetical protein